MKEDDSDDRNEQPMPRHHSPQENSAVRHRGVAGKPVAERSAQQLRKFFSFLSKQDPGSWRWQVGSVFTYLHGVPCLLETAFRNSGDASHVTARRVAICGPC
jgi:hypothetical protein